MTCFPIFYAVIENDLRRVLAYSMINQLGFMVVGIGIGTELALNGAVAHAFNDVIFKGLLMMSMGAVLHVTGEIRGSELGGLYKKMPKTAVLCMVGAASISAFPLFSGFVSKSMVVSAARSRRATHSSGWRCCSHRPACSTTPASRSRSSPSSPTTRASSRPRTSRRATCCSP